VIPDTVVILIHVIIAEDNNWWTAIQLAAFGVHNEVEQLLVVKGAYEPEDFYGLQSLFLGDNITSTCELSEWQ
jgi:hypothetical protein